MWQRFESFDVYFSFVVFVNETFLLSIEAVPIRHHVPLFVNHRTFAIIPRNRFKFHSKGPFL